MYQWIINLLGMVGLAISTPPIASESGGVSAGSASAGATGATEQAVESLFGALSDPSGLVKAVVSAAAANIEEATTAQNAVFYYLQCCWRTRDA